MTKLAREYFRNKEWKYHLQGSRSKDGFLSFDKYSTEDSDWDYYLDDSQHRTFREFKGLTDDGWKALDTLDYQDCSTSRVFEKQFPDGKVQVSLRFRYEHMCRAWDSVSSNFYGRYLNKRSEKYLGKEFVRDFLDMLYHMPDEAFTIKPLDRFV